MNPYRWVILGVGTLAQSSFGAVVVGLPALAPVLRTHYHLSLGQTGVMLGATTLGMLPTLLPWGLLADRIGERIVIALGLAAAGVAIAMVPLTSSFGGLLVVLVLTGALGASINAASGRAVMGWFDAEQRGLALGVRQTSIPIGGALGALVLPSLASGGNPRDAFLALGGFCIVAAVVAGVLMREAPAREGPLLVDLSRPFRGLSNWLLGLSSGLFVLAQLAFTSYAVLFLHQHRGLTTHAAALVLAAVNVISIGSRIAAGHWSDTVGSRIRPLRIVGVLISMATAAVAVLVDAPLAALIPMMIVAGVLSLSWNSIAFTAAAETAGVARSGAALGFQQTVLGAVFAAATPAFAAVVDLASWRTAFAAAAVGPLLGVVALRGVPEVSGAGRSLGTSVIPPAIP
jgi:sugar phosphate permease